MVSPMTYLVVLEGEPTYCGDTTNVPLPMGNIFQGLGLGCLESERNLRKRYKKEMSRIARNPKLISYLNIGLVLEEVRPVKSAPVNDLCLPQEGCLRLTRDPVTGKLPKPFDVIVFGKNIIKLKPGEDIASNEKSCSAQRTLCPGGTVSKSTAVAGMDKFLCCKRSETVFYNDISDSCMCVSGLSTFEQEIPISEEKKAENDAKLGVIRPDALAIPNLKEVLVNQSENFEFSFSLNDYILNRPSIRFYFSSDVNNASCSPNADYQLTKALGLVSRGQTLTVDSSGTSLSPSALVMVFILRALDLFIKTPFLNVRISIVLYEIKYKRWI